ncbi:MAG: DUF1508 domain-containing protein [Ruminococcaceae bacterium]|nr:DUF1508 domain-containing protein [Oscillospiraceae bacterium]
MGKFIIKNTKTGYMFNLLASNGEPIATSEVYTSRAGCKNGIASVQKNAPIAAMEDQTALDFEPIMNPKFEVYVDKSGEFRFRLKATNGQVIAASEGYKTKSSCLNGVASVRKNAPDAPIADA